jgi:riboflavin biosynthesis pyrimidine reductase
VLYAEGIRSLMVEGGAQVIDSFLARPSLVHRVIITIAPIFVGQAGVGYGIASVVRRDQTRLSLPGLIYYRPQMPTTKLLKSEIFGQDVVTALCFIET